MQGSTAIDPAYQELRGQLPESDRAKFDEMVEAGCPLELLAEEVDRYLGMRRFWVEVPQEAKYGLDRMLVSGEALKGLPDEEVIRLYHEHLKVERAGDFTEAHRQRFMRQAHLARVRAISSNDSTARTKPRPRGAGRPKVRGSSRRSSARSGDSGDDSDSSSSSDSSEPATRRLCAFCGKDIPADRSPKATHCSDRHADRDRQRRKRQRDRERSQLPPTPTTADFRRMLEITDEQPDWLRALVDCRCNGRHLEFDPGECFRCGHRLPREQVAA